MNEELKGHEERNRVAAQKRFKVPYLLIMAAGDQIAGRETLQYEPKHPLAYSAADYLLLNDTRHTQHARRLSAYHLSWLSTTTKPRLSRNQVKVEVCFLVISSR